MSEISKRLDNLRQMLAKEDFLLGRGLSNEVNIHIFCYAPQDELQVEQYVQQLRSAEHTPYHLHECNLYRIFLALCAELDIMEAIEEVEASNGAAYLVEQLQTAISSEDFVRYMEYSPHRTGDVLLITGVGDVYPYLRVHTLLEALQPHYTDIPIVVLYPGKFDGYHLQLFNRLQPNDYYRAFNVL